MARPDKEAAVKEIEEKLKEAKSLVITDYIGLDVAEMTELRAKLREAGVDYKVVKNTLARIAANNSDFSEINEFFNGPTAIAFGIDDVVAPAKILDEFAEEHEVLEIKGGYLNGEIISKDKVESLAKIPSRDELLGKAFASMKAPITGFVNVLNGNLRNFVNVLSQIKDQKE
ncbi:MAG: 50S ribosomal protein L10 [Halanaerobiales bacterium]|nr:50S ribosomal protein L10 [Halanaerobiales bacterium]